MAEKKQIPELRFPEFDGEWNEVPLGSFLTFKNGVNASKEDYGSGYKFINVLDIIENNFITYDRIQGSVQIDPDVFEMNRVDYGDVLFQRSSETREEVGQANVYLDEKPATFGGFVIRGKKISEYDPRYMNYLLRTQNSRKEIIARSGGSTRYNVGQSILSEIEVILTGLPEQQKIASFLSSVDERLRLLQQKKEKLERYKKGVIQKLFPKAGEKTPEIRFKDDNGKDFPEWEEKTLGRMGEFFGGGTPDKSKQEFWEGNIPWVSSSDIEEGSIRNIKITRFITDEAIKNSATKRIPKGSILIVSRVGIGKFALAETELCTSQDFTSFYPQELHAEFLTYYFVSQPQRLQRFAQGTSIKGFTSKNLRDLKLYIPMSKKEQQKIASFLSSIDRSIEKLETEITGTEKFKKGLLQKMFV